MLIWKTQYPPELQKNICSYSAIQLEIRKRNLNTDADNPSQLLPYSTPPRSNYSTRESLVLVFDRQDDRETLMQLNIHNVRQKP